MLMTNPTTKLVSVYGNGVRGFYTLKPNDTKEVGEHVVKAAKALGLVEAISPKVEESPKKPEIKKEAPKGASSPSFDVHLDSDFEVAAFLDQNVSTTISKLSKLEISVEDMKKLLDYEKKNRNSKQLIKYLEERHG